MPDYIVTEVARYRVEAESADEALAIYLQGGGDFLVVTDRDVVEDE
jgi:ApbE superfamily uncharacterized protein (UPF0280 family)